MKVPPVVERNEICKKNELLCSNIDIAACLVAMREFSQAMAQLDVALVVEPRGNLYLLLFAFAPHSERNPTRPPCALLPRNLPCAQPRSREGYQRPLCVGVFFFHPANSVSVSLNLVQYY